MDNLPKIKPLFGNILVEEVEEAEQKTSTGILIPQTASDKSQQKMGRVLATGEGEYIPVVAYTDKDTHEAVIARTPMKIEIGNIVVFKGWGSVEIKLKGKNYLILNQKDVLAIVEK